MNELQAGDVIARLRSALDEVTAESDGLVAIEVPRPRVSAGRWMAVAAAVVLIAGAVTAIAIKRGHAPEVSTAPTELPTTSPDTTLVATEPVLIRTETPWFRLIAADLVPGERTHEQCCRASLPGRQLVMAWSAPNVPAYLMVTEFPDPGPSIVVGATHRKGTDGTLLFQSYGLTDQERETLADQVVPGSGLPYILTADGWRVEAVGQTAGDSRLVQMYTPLNNDPLSSYLPTITMSVGEYRGELASLAAWPDPQPITVAGYEGWKVTEGDGIVSAFWYVDNGNWATLRIDAMLADRADALIAGVVEVTEVEAKQPTIETVLAPTEPVSELAVAGDVLPPFDSAAATDPAVGMPAPTIIGFDYGGNEVRIDPAEGPHLVLFQAHWCPHCAANLPKVVGWMADGTIPSWLQVTLVSTAESPTSPNYPADKWLEEYGWNGRVIRDSNDGAGTAEAGAGAVATAYGTPGSPFVVVVGVDGQVLARATGELTQAAMEQLLEGLPNGQPVGRLEIPAIDFDWLVIDNPLGAQAWAGLVPVLVSGPVPGQTVDGGVSVLWGTRTTYSAPFLDIDKLVAGDVVLWAGTDGTEARFEVIGSAIGEDAQAPEGTALELRTYTPEFTSNETLIVYARRTA